MKYIYQVLEGGAKDTIILDNSFDTGIIRREADGEFITHIVPILNTAPPRQRDLVKAADEEVFNRVVDILESPTNDPQENL